MGIISTKENKRRRSMKKNQEKKSLKRQLVSGAVYVALASVVIAVTVNTTVGIISDRNAENFEKNLGDINTNLPSVPKIPSPNIPKTDISPAPDLSSPVSDTSEGIDATVTDTTDVTQEISIPEDAYLGFDKYINPCGGFVTKEFSLEVPVYSATMGDYRTHAGIDISADKGTQVYACIGGVVTEIYDDDLLGKTVCMKNADGYIIKYSNLLPDLHAGVEVGAVLETGSLIGGVGDTAISEYVEASHLHLEMLDQSGEYVNPEDYINF